ncbi:MAG TPA: iron-sulfur cluster assembly accessory protein [Planctomycetota bacterium]|nr:iron-sulfur cluster assembly accessory protein [Planctomycetota bacterium]
MGCCNEGGGGHAEQGGHGHAHGGHGHSHGGAEAQPSATAVQAPSRFSGQIAVTDKAAEKLCELMVAEKKDPAVYGLRLGVQGGGCSGMTYFMDFDTPRADDKVFENKGARVLVDPKSILYVSGSVLEYSEGLMGSGFQIKNPNVKSSCGCGSSFNT